MNHGSFKLDVNMPSTRTGGARRLLADIKKKTLRSRILSALFGEQHELVIIMPSRNVDTVTFTRASENPEAMKAATQMDNAFSGEEGASK